MLPSNAGIRPAAFDDRFKSFSLRCAKEISFFIALNSHSSLSPNGETLANSIVDFKIKVARK